MGVLGGGGGVDHRENRGVTNVGYGVSDGLDNRCRQEGGRLWQWSVLLESVYRLWVVLPSSYILIGSLFTLIVFRNLKAQLTSHEQVVCSIFNYTGVSLPLLSFVAIPKHI